MQSSIIIPFQMTISLHLKFPSHLTIAQFINEVDCQPVSTQHCLKTYYDSFDWRLYSSGLICEFVAPNLSLIAVKNGLAIAKTELHDVPKFSQQFAHGLVRYTIEPLLDMRALLTVCKVAYKFHQFNIINDDKKTVLRLFVEEHEQIAHRVFLQSLKGYDEVAESMINQLTAQLGLTLNIEPVLLEALALQGRTVNDYSSKMAISLTADMRADVACKIIYSCLLKTIKDNEQGTIADIDSEFLHDFRVSVRRTRSALTQLKDVLPNDIHSRYVEFFSWLGTITSPTRDLDVYLLNFAQYKDSLPLAMRDYLNPLHEFLLKKQQHAQQKLAENLRSTNYLMRLSAWEQYLAEPLLLYPNASNAQLSIKHLANKRLQKNFKRVVREGNAISDQSPAEDLHELRKSCKKLRYLMEFFQSLYSPEKIKNLIKSLKGLQEVLGDFQDCSVQEENLRLFSEEMHTLNIPDETFVAIEHLITNIDNRKHESRSHFAEKFAAFTEEDTLATFKQLFG